MIMNINLYVKESVKSLPIRNKNKKSYIDFKNKSYPLNYFTHGGNSMIFKFTDDMGNNYVVKVFVVLKKAKPIKGTKDLNLR